MSNFNKTMNLNKKIAAAKVSLYNLLEELNEQNNDSLSPCDSELLFLLEGDESISDEIEEIEKY